MDPRAHRSLALVLESLLEILAVAVKRLGFLQNGLDSQQCPVFLVCEYVK